MQIIVTGGSGKVGRAAIQELLEHGHQVLNLDLVAPAVSLAPFCRVNLADFGEVYGALSGIDNHDLRADAIIHLAAIPAPGLRPDHVTFSKNILSVYNVFEAARRLGIRNVVWASSETVVGYPFSSPPPSVPVDESVRQSEMSYPLSKLLGEVMAEEYCRRDPQQKIICLRFSNVLDDDDYARAETWQQDPHVRKWNLWSYIDVRDAAQAVRRAVESDLTGMHPLIIANADTVMHRPSRELMAEVFPDVPFTAEIEGNASLFSIQKARDLLGFDPTHGWRK